MKRGFLILDFGSQYTWLIARSFRELGYYSELCPYDESLDQIKEKKPFGVVLSGGPASVLNPSSPKRSVDELLNIAPILGICYGMQLIAFQKGGSLESSSQRTYGWNEIYWKKSLIPNLIKQKVWMSHGDSIKSLPPQAQLLSKDSKSLITAFSMDRLLAFQFHPEVSHTERGQELFKYFAQELCQAPPGSWKGDSIQNFLISKIKHQVPKNQKIFCALSGGVDSTVTAVLLSQVLGAQRILCLFVDTGLLRLGEYEEVLHNYSSLNLNIKGVRAGDRFFKALKGVCRPEEKRKIIGNLFIDIFKEEMEDCKYLAQGTLYPDIIESLSIRGQSEVIKSHHNVGGLPKDLNLNLIEPLKDLFKDEVRELGKNMGLSSSFLNRHPFPGPGLAVRCLGEVSPDQIQILQKADAIYIEELKKQSLYDQIWQAFCVLLPIKTVGVQGDSRTYGQVLSLRAVVSTDGMTADWFPLPPAFLKKLSSRIVNEIPQVNRVVYDITGKPPGTIEWE